MTNRPYPPGIAWDEAWAQRQRADALEEAAAEVIRAAAIGDQNFIGCLRHEDDATRRLRLTIVKLADLLRGETE
jgi:3-dehydroquinate synthetase